MPIKIKSNNEQFICYQQNDGLILAKIFEDYHTLFKYSGLLEDEILGLKKQKLLLENDSKIWEQNAENMKKRGDLYLKEFEMQKNLYNDLSEYHQKSTKYFWIPWALTAVVGVGFGIALAIN
ncbi:MAG: hypothetical protein BV456_09910 [Thermoplasmata archaeon M8B2D]|nr:MAG: hypothetical protein BV456_09910 [Thermoplasmata archaeon M8B2D]